MDYSSLYAIIAQNIYENHDGQVTAEMVKAACDSMVASLGYGYQFRGAAAPGDAGPGNIDQRVFYIASTPGTYSGFGGLTLAANEVALLKWDTAWSKETLDIPSKTQIMARLAAQDAQIAVQDGRLDGQDEEIADFEAAVQDQVDNYPMITINGNVTNAPDEEDITSDANDLLKFKNRSAVDGMGYIILRRNKTFAEQVTAANTIYEIRYDFNLGGASVTIPAGCVLKFVGGSLSSGDILLNDTLLIDPILDVNITGVCSNRIAFQSWFRDIDKWLFFIGNVDGPTTYEFSPGVYDATVSVFKKSNSAVIIHGNGAQINWTEENAAIAGVNGVFHIECKNAPGTPVNIIKAINTPTAVIDTIVGSDYVDVEVADISQFYDGCSVKFINTLSGECQFVRNVTISGNVLRLPEMIGSGLISAGNNVVFLNNCRSFFVDDSSVFNIGDIVALRDHKASSFYWSRNYQEGEYVKIQKISGNQIYTANVIEGIYANVGELTACKVEMIDVEITDLHLHQTNFSETPLVTRGMFNYLCSPRLANVKVTGFQVCLISGYCWHISVRDCIAANAEANYASDGYALYFISCQDVNIVGGLYCGRNHGIAFGGPYIGDYNVINRGILIEMCETSNTMALKGLSSINTHDNSDNVVITNCKALGIGVGGKRFRITNNVVDDAIQLIAANNFEHIISNNRVGNRIFVYQSDADSSYEHEFGNTLKVVENQQLLIHHNICGNLEVDYRHFGNAEVDASKIKVRIDNNIINELLYVYLGGDYTSSNRYKYSSIHNGGDVDIVNNKIMILSQSETIVARHLNIKQTILYNQYTNHQIYADHLVIDHCDMVYNISSAGINLYCTKLLLRDSITATPVIYSLPSSPSDNRGNIMVHNNRIITSSVWWLLMRQALYTLYLFDNIIDSEQQLHCRHQPNPAQDPNSKIVFGNNRNLIGTLCPWATYEGGHFIAIDEYNIVGLSKMSGGIPLWWNGTAWVDATGQAVNP